MTTELLTVRTDTPVREVARLLWEHDIGGAPVLDARGSLVGLISARDLLRPQADGVPVAGRAGESVGLTAGDLMMPATFSIRPEATVAELTEFLRRSGVHRALVMSRGHLLGIVTSSDLLRHLAEPEGS
jgi:CBS domain-containing protein